MLERKAFNFLENWKNTKQNECLLIKGARQIGKTFIVREFAKNHYENFIEINFEKNPEMKAAFDGSLDVENLIKEITVRIPRIKMVPNKTLLFLDEIQACPQARTALKFLAQQNNFDVIATGSLLGINYKDISSIPVGYERQYEMHSLDFEEFLWAIGIDKTVISSLKNNFDKNIPVSDETNKVMQKNLREFMLVGGMPAVINKFLETNNYNEVHDEQQKILNDYLNDIAKYASTADKPKARNCYLSIPRQLAKENTKFKFGEVEKGGTARKYANCLDWLRDANLIRYCYNCVPPEFPLAAYVRQEQFRIYTNDIGLLICMYGFEMKQAILTDSLKGSAKGGIYENLIADFLVKKGYPLYYFKRDDSSSEVEFLIEKECSVVPIEVKSKKGSTSSLDTILKKEDVKLGYKIIDGNLGITEKKKTIPHYMTMFI
ncbi:MAG: ATP-binding protein [Treponema sp.]|nr:ATP-binding protein [Treponema sp.]